MTDDTRVNVLHTGHVRCRGGKVEYETIVNTIIKGRIVSSNIVWSDSSSTEDNALQSAA